MKSIIWLGDKNKTRQRIRFTCRWCGCVFDTDEGDYTKRSISQIKTNIAGKEVWEDKYEYHTSCPICGRSIWEDDSHIEVWEYTDYEDGTESFVRIK